MGKVTHERLREVLAYDPLTGLFTRRATYRKWLAGSVAGCLDTEGYVVVPIDGANYKAHRLAWLYMTGRWPAPMIDHIDGRRANNVFSNLREATNGQNMANARLRSDNKSGFKGASYHKGARKWIATIRQEGRSRYLGQFDTPEAAHAAYIEAAQRAHGAFARAA